MVVKYEPVAGLTVREALVHAVKKAKENKCIVITIINDVVMLVNKNTNIDKALTEYNQKLNLKFYTQNVRHYTNNIKGTR